MSMSPNELFDRIARSTVEEMDEAIHDESVRQRLGAWERVVNHPFFKECFLSEDTLINAMVAKLDRAHFTSEHGDQG